MLEYFIIAHFLSGILTGDAYNTEITVPIRTSGERGDRSYRVIVVKTHDPKVCML